MADTYDEKKWEQLQEAAMKYEEYKQKAKLAQLTIPKNPFTGSTLPITSPPQRPGRPVGSKTKDKEVIIQETVDRLIDQVVKLLTKHNFDEDRLSDADIVVDEKSNYAFVTVTVGLPNGSIISVSERVKVANKTDPSKNWQDLNKAFTVAAGRAVAQKIDEDLSNVYITAGPKVDSTNNDF